MTVLLSFGLYMVGVFVLAIAANRAGRKKAFVSEYFLGSKSIGLWAFAFTYAATSASGGSFMGFPSLIYTHGWVLAWWIAGYMVVPIIALGLLAKRINQVGRIAGAITIPELLRRRFESREVGNLATLLVVFFMFFFLMAQFKAGAQIMATLLEGVPVYESAVVGVEKITADLPWIGAAEGDYLLCLLVFAVSVIAYTTFGGFRAVVWTDVMQGVVMGFGVIIMLVLTLAQVGGLGNATRKLGEMTPPQEVRVHVILDEPAREPFRVPKGEWIRLGEDGVVRLRSSFTIVPHQRESELVEAFRVTTQAEIDQLLQSEEMREGMKATLFGDPKPYAYGDGVKGVYLTAPGPSATSTTGFLGVMLALSFFSFWTFSGAGQPSYMVRQMAFRDTLTLRRSIVMVAVYFSLIYFPLVIIFTCARVLLPGMEVHPDRVMPEMATLLTNNAGMPWLAGLLIAAPFAAVMSSVDSFLLLVSSGVVRDVYQESINPKASEKQVKRLSYLVTIVVGILGVLAVMHPPQFLQHLIIFAAAGLGACFLMPMIFALYWSRSTSRGIIAGMLAGGITVLTLYLIGFLVTKQFGEYLLLGVHPFLWAVLLSSLAIVVGSLSQEPVSGRLKERYFGVGSPSAQR
ncbi:MAG: hypothetical protein AAGF67_15690 [Verrucomicrobiota bacterium]